MKNLCTGIISIGCLLAASISAASADTLQLTITPLPAASKSAFTDQVSRPHIMVHKDGYNWCPSVLQTEDGKYHMFHTRWPKSIGFLSWLTHSEIVHAVADKPEGPYTEVAVAIPPSGQDRGGWFTAHNSKIKKFGDTYYLYFCQTRGDSFKQDGEAKRVEMAKTGYRHPLWVNEARPNQRTFAATSHSIDGPWEISEEPIIQPSKTITTLTVNPAVCQGPDGTYFMIIKGDKPGGRGARNQALATATTPEGPWTIRDKPVIDNLDTEDTSIWYDQTRQRFYAVFHAHTFIGMMTSTDGFNWERAAQYKLSPKEIPFDDGTVWKPQRMERPFVLTDDQGRAQMLFVACKKGDMAVNIALPLAVRDSEFEAEKIDLFILAGQSNAQGWMGDAAHYPADPDGIDETIRFYWETPGYSSSGGAWSHLQPQDGRFSKGHFGLEVTFARSLKLSGYNTALFKYSLGSTSIANHWKGPGDGRMYDRMTEELAKAIARLRKEGHQVTVRGFIWIQGESDAQTPAMAEAYKGRLKILLNDLRMNETKQPELPVVLGVDEQHPWVKMNKQVVQAQQALATENKNTVFSTMVGLEKADSTHLTPKGLEAHGTRIYTVYKELTCSRKEEVPDQ